MRKASGTRSAAAPPETAARLPAVEVEQFAHQHTVEKWTAVQSFLETHRELISLLEEAPRQIGQHFPKSPLYLELVADPEERDDVQLIIAIAPVCPPADAMARFDAFTDAWWLDKLDAAGDALGIVVAYR